MTGHFTKSIFNRAGSWFIFLRHMLKIILRFDITKRVAEVINICSCMGYIDYARKTKREHNNDGQPKLHS